MKCSHDIQFGWVYTGYNCGIERNELPWGRKLFSVHQGPVQQKISGFHVLFMNVNQQGKSLPSYYE